MISYKKGKKLEFGKVVFFPKNKNGFNIQEKKKEIAIYFCLLLHFFVCEHFKDSYSVCIHVQDV